MDVPINLTLSEGLQLITAIFGGTYFGCMLYVCLIEANSRKDLPLLSHWEQWCNSYRRAGKLMPLAGLVTAAASMGVFYLEKNAAVRNLWLVPPGAVLFIILYTLVFMLKLNNSILDKKNVEDKGGKWVKESTARWERFHRVRVLAMLVSQCVTLYAIIKL